MEFCHLQGSPIFQNIRSVPADLNPHFINVHAGRLNQKVASRRRKLTVYSLPVHPELDDPLAKDSHGGIFSIKLVLDLTIAAEARI